MLTPREKSPPLQKFSSEEYQTHDAASSRTASATHYQRAIPAPAVCSKRQDKAGSGTSLYAWTHKHKHTHTKQTDNKQRQRQRPEHLHNRGAYLTDDFVGWHKDGVVPVGGGGHVFWRHHKAGRCGQLDAGLVLAAFLQETDRRWKLFSELEKVIQNDHIISLWGNRPGQLSRSG